MTRRAYASVVPEVATAGRQARYRAARPRQSWQSRARQGSDTRRQCQRRPIIQHEKERAAQILVLPACQRIRCARSVVHNRHRMPAAPTFRNRKSDHGKPVERRRLRLEVPVRWGHRRHQLHKIKDRLSARRTLPQVAHGRIQYSEMPMRRPVIVGLALVGLPLRLSAPRVHDATALPADPAILRRSLQDSKTAWRDLPPVPPGVTRRGSPTASILLAPRAAAVVNPGGTAAFAADGFEIIDGSGRMPETSPREPARGSPTCLRNRVPNMSFGAFDEPRHQPPRSCDRHERDDAKVGCVVAG
jgi:hypothetical protein